MQDDGNGKVRDERTKTLVMPLQNGTQKDLGLGPDFHRDDDDDYRANLELSTNGNKGLKPPTISVTSPSP